MLIEYDILVIAEDGHPPKTVVITVLAVLAPSQIGRRQEGLCPKRIFKRSDFGYFDLMMRIPMAMARVKNEVPKKNLFPA